MSKLFKTSSVDQVMLLPLTIQDLASGPLYSGHGSRLAESLRHPDWGKEMAEHERLAPRLSIQVFFADPHSLGQRRTNENTNGLLCQYLPKGTDLSGYTQRDLNTIADRVNTRLQKFFHWATPLEIFTQWRQHSSVAFET